MNISYLTGFSAQEAWLLVSPKRAFYITDFRYILEAQAALQGVMVKRYTFSIVETFFELASKMNVKKIGFDDRHLSLALFKSLKSHCPAHIRLIPKSDIVERLREIKTDFEITQIKKAVELNVKAMDFLRRIIKPGLTEKEVSSRLENFVKSHNASFAFDPIIASGPNSCFPHAKISNRKIRNNEHILIDTGINVEGYKSDLTRIVFLGKISHLVREIYAAVRTAQSNAINKIKAQVLARDIDQEARNYLRGKKLDEFFGHSLGHGVGLEVHEDPCLSPKSKSVLRKRMVVTVEPAVYLPEKFGVRIEDMVLITKEGCEILTGKCNSSIFYV